MCLVFFCPSGNILPGNLPGTSGGNIAARNAGDKSRQRNAGGKKVDSAMRTAKKSTAQRGRQKSAAHRGRQKSRQHNADKMFPAHAAQFRLFAANRISLFAARHIFLHNFRCYRRRGDLLKMPGSGRTISRKNGDGNNFQGDGNYYHLPLNSCFSFVYFRETGFSRISERAEANPAKKQKCPIFIILHDHNFFWR